MINKFTIYGENYSGVDYFKKAIEENIGLTYEISNEDNYNDDTFLFICIVRNPLVWISQFFINNQEVNIIEILESRYKLYNFLINTISNKLKNYILIKFEDIILNYEVIIKYIIIKYNLKLINNFDFKISFDQIENIDLLNLQSSTNNILFKKENNDRIIKNMNNYDNINSYLLKDNQLKVFMENINFDIEDKLKYNIIPFVPKVCFYHIEKCMGSTLRFCFYNYFKQIYNINEIFDPEIKNENNLVNNNDLLTIYQKKYTIILSHCSFNKEGVTDYFSKHCFSITCIREPIKRFISHYYCFDQKNYNKNIQEFNNEELIKVLFSLKNTHVWRLSGETDILELALNNIKSFNCILVQEKITEEVEYLNKILNTKFNVNNVLLLNNKNVAKFDYKNLNDYDFLKNNYYEYFKDDYILYNTIVSMDITDRIKL
jgi:hypothetical protein